jgi:hypothetical protein
MFTQEERSSSSKMGMVGTGFYKKDKPLFKNRFNKFVSDYGVVCLMIFAYFEYK